MKANELTYNINGERLTALEIYLLEDIITEHNGVYQCTSPSDDHRETIDMLVLSGVLERDKGHAGGWVDTWRVTPSAWSWVEPVIDLVSFVKFTVGEA